MIVLKLDDKTGQILDTYKTLVDAAKKNNSKPSGIRHSCIFCNRGSVCKGFRWIAVKSIECLESYYRDETLEEVNEKVFKDREIKEDSYNKKSRYKRDATISIVCNGCNNKVSIRDIIKAYDVSIENDLEIHVEDKNIHIECYNCETKIQIA